MNDEDDCSKAYVG